jgi:hypothetical protein
LFEGFVEIQESDREVLSGGCGGLCGLAAGMAIQTRSYQIDVHCDQNVQNVEARVI